MGAELNDMAIKFCSNEHTRGNKHSNVDDKKTKVLHPGEEMTQIIWVTKVFSFHVKAKKKEKKRAKSNTLAGISLLNQNQKKQFYFGLLSGAVATMFTNTESKMTSMP